MPRRPVPNQWVIDELYDLRDRLVRGGLVRIEDVRVTVGAVPGATRRTKAGTSSDGKSIILTPALDRLDVDTVRGILMHELGHAVDFLYPAMLTIEGSDLVVDDLRTPTAARMRTWKRRSDDAIERFADQIAEHSFDVKIGYAGPCLLQTTRGGIRPRPPGLS